MGAKRRRPTSGSRVIAIAPDLLSGQTYSGVDEARKAISQLSDPQVMADLDAVAAYVAKLPASNGKVTAVGFCWGGGTVFKFANHNRDLKATYVFYGRGPSDRAGAESIQGPVYGFYAENDARVNETLPETTEAMRAAGKTFEPQIYPGAGHGFMERARRLTPRRQTLKRATLRGHAGNRFWSNSEARPRNESMSPSPRLRRAVER